MSKGVSAPYEVVGIEAVAVEGVAVMERGQGQDTSLAGQLRDLQASKEQDLLSEAEYAAARASVLARFRDGAPAAAPIPTPITPNPALNGQLNDTARNTSDTGRIRDLVSRGAQLESTNGAPWNHTPLHQACYHGRLVIVQTLLEVFNPIYTIMSFKPTLSVLHCVLNPLGGGVREVRAAGIQPLREGGPGPAHRARSRRPPLLHRGPPGSLQKW